MSVINPNPENENSKSQILAKICHSCDRSTGDIQYCTHVYRGVTSSGMCDQLLNVSTLETFVVRMVQVYVSDSVAPIWNFGNNRQ